MTTENTINNQANLMQWWEHPGLADCRSYAIMSIRDIIDDIQQLCPIKNGYENYSRKKTAAALMPPAVHEISEITKSSSIYGEKANWEGSRHVDGDLATWLDSPQIVRYKYGGDDHVIPYAAMLHTWMVEGCMIATGEMRLSQDFNPVMYNVAVGFWADEKQAQESKESPQLSIYRDGDVRPHAVRNWSHFADSEAFGCSRELVINTLSSVVERSLDCLPEQLGATLREHDNMFKIFGMLEPNTRHSYVSFFKFKTDYYRNQPRGHNFSPTFMQSIVKMWWSEVRDLFLFNLEPPIPFEIDAYAINHIQSSIKSSQGHSAECNDTQLNLWFEKNKTHYAMRHFYWAAKGDTVRMKQHDDRISPQHIDNDIHTYKSVSA